MGQGGCEFPAGPGRQVITLSGDLGNHQHLIDGKKKNEFNGWSGSVLALAMLAYNNESDLVYQEQDCLAFGKYIQRLYEDCPNNGMVFGRGHRTAPFQMCSQSLFLVKFQFLRAFICRYFGGGPQTNNHELGEPKFKVLQNQSQGLVRQFDWGYDRERPFDTCDEVFYVQQCGPEDLAKLVAAGLVNPENV